jgi:hypothetical protein
MNRHHLVCAAFVLFQSACSATLPDVRPMRLSDIAKNPLIAPFVLQIEQGDRIPVKFALSGDLVQSLEDNAPLTIVAKRRFFVWIRDDGPPVISLDGKTAAHASGGRLSVGLDAMQGTPELSIGVDQSFAAQSNF